MKKMIFGAVAVLGITGAATAQDALAYWHQNDNALSGGGFGFEVGDFPQGADFGLQAGTANITFGGGILSETNPDGVYSWIQSFAGGSVNAQFGEPSGGSISIQGGTDVQNNGSYLEFNFDASVWQDIDFSFAGRRTGSGFDNVTISAYNGGSFLGDLTTGLDLTGDNLNAPTAFQSFSTNLLDGVTDATIRMTFDGATGATGNVRLDNLFIQGNLIPTPGSAAIIGLAGLAAVRRRR